VGRDKGTFLSEASQTPQSQPSQAGSKDPYGRIIFRLSAQLRTASQFARQHTHHRTGESGRLAHLHHNSIISRSDYTSHEGSIFDSIMPILKRITNRFSDRVSECGVEGVFGVRWVPQATFDFQVTKSVRFRRGSRQNPTTRFCHSTLFPHCPHEWPYILPLLVRACTPCQKIVKPFSFTRPARIEN
jgi:hypothetical protein